MQSPSREAHFICKIQVASVKASASVTWFCAGIGVEPQTPTPPSRIFVANFASAPLSSTYLAAMVRNGGPDDSCQSYGRRNSSWSCTTPRQRTRLHSPATASSQVVTGIASSWELPERSRGPAGPRASRMQWSPDETSWASGVRLLPRRWRHRGCHPAPAPTSGSARRAGASSP